MGIFVSGFVCLHACARAHVSVRVYERACAYACGGGEGGGEASVMYVCSNIHEYKCGSAQVKRGMLETGVYICLFSTSNRGHPLRAKYSKLLSSAL